MKQLQLLVLNEFSLPCTVALSANKLVSKIAAGTVKPNGVITVPHGTEASFLAPLPVASIPGVGKKTEEFLVARGFRTVADVQKHTQLELLRLLGKHGLWIHNASLGRGSESVEPDTTRKSISREETFDRDIQDLGSLEKILFDLTEDVCSTMRKKTWKARTVSIKFRYSDFSTFTRDKTIEPTNNDPAIFATAVEMLRENMDRRRKLRLIGVRLSHFVDDAQMELTLDASSAKQQSVLKVVDAIRRKHGSEAVHLGTGLDAEREPPAGPSLGQEGS